MKTRFNSDGTETPHSNPDRDALFHAAIWRALLMIVRAYGAWRGYCKDIVIVKE